MRIRNFKNIKSSQKIILLFFLLGVLYFLTEINVHYIGVRYLGYHKIFTALNISELLWVLGIFAGYILLGLVLSRLYVKKERAEYEIREAYEELRRVFDTAGNGIVVISRNCEIVRVNQPFLNIVGKKEEEVLGQNCKDIINSKYCSTEGCPLESLLQSTEGSIQYEEVDLFYNDKKIPCRVNVSALRDANGNLTGIVENIEDITLKVEHEKEMNRRIAMESLLSSISAFFIGSMPDSADMGINFALERLGTISGVDRTYVFLYYGDDCQIMSNTHEWCSPGIEQQIDNLQNIETSNIPWWTNTLRRFDHIYVPVVKDMEQDIEREVLMSQDIQSLLVVPLSSGQRLTGFLGMDSVRQEKRWDYDDIMLLRTVADVISNALVREKEIGRRKALFENIKRTNKELEEFAYIVSHDLKAPLRGIGTIANWLKTDYGDKLEGEGKEYLNLLIGRVKRMNDLIEGVLHYSRTSRKEEPKEKVDVKDIIREAMELAAPPENIRIITGKRMPIILCEPIKMKQVFENLISNAVKFMDKPNGEIKINCADSDGFWEFSVADNGPGIPKEHFDRVFQIFQTLSARDDFESTGIGLTLVKKIITIHGGKVWIESEMGKGSTFYFTIPKN